jgi:hypothetical protein
MSRMSDMFIDMMQRCADDGNDWDMLTDEQRKQYETEQMTIAEREYEEKREQEFVEYNQTVDRR